MRTMENDESLGKRKNLYSGTWESGCLVKKIIYNVGKRTVHLPFNQSNKFVFREVSNEILAHFVESQEVETDDRSDCPDVRGRSVDVHYVLEDRCVDEHEEQEDLENL